MAKQLKTYVHVPDEQGAYVQFGPDDDVPGWAEKLITNPDAWDTGEEAPVVPTPGPSQLPGESVDDVGSGPLNDRKIGQLRNLANARGIDSGGSKSALAKRLADAGFEATNESTTVEA